MKESNILDILDSPEWAEEMMKSFHKFKKNIDFFRSNESSFLKKYPNEWIAIQDGKVVAISKTLDGLRLALERGKIDTRTCITEFLDPDPEPLLLVDNLSKLRTIKPSRQLGAFLFLVSILKGHYLRESYEVYNLDMAFLLCYPFDNKARHNFWRTAMDVWIILLLLWCSAGSLGNVIGLWKIRACSNNYIRRNSTSWVAIFTLLSLLALSGALNLYFVLLTRKDSFWETES